MSDRKFKQVGTRPIRHDGLEKVTGRANFGADYSLPGMLHGAVLRSPHAHAKIVSIDASPALEVDGVKAVITAQDFPTLTRAGEREAVWGRHPTSRTTSSPATRCSTTATPWPRWRPPASRQARRGAEKIRVEYEVLPPVLDIESAIAQDAPILHDDLVCQGPAPLPSSPTNLLRDAQCFRAATLEQGFAEVRRGGRTRVHDADGPPGLHRAARNGGQHASGRQCHHLVLHPGAVRRSSDDLDP